MPDLRRMMTLLGSLSTTGRLLQRSAGQRREAAHQLVGDLAGHRTPPRLLEALEGGASPGVVEPGRLQRAVAEIGERALHRDDAGAWRQQCRDWIVALDRDRLRLDGRARDRREQDVVRLGRRTQPRRLLKIADRRIGLWAIDAVGRAVIEAVPRQLALD